MPYAIDLLNDDVHNSGQLEEDTHLCDNVSVPGG